MNIRQGMRVLHVSSGNMFGGIESMLVTLAQHRAVCPEMEPAFALSFEGRVHAELMSTRVPVYVLGGVRASRPLTVVRARRRLTELLTRAQFDVVICHSPWPQAVFGPAVRMASIPLVYWAHGPADGGHWTQRWAARTPPDFAICNSQFTAESLPLLYPSCRYAVIHCPVAAPVSAISHEDRQRVRRELSTPPRATVVLQVSRLEPWKGQATLLEALSLLRDQPEWVCWIVGNAQTKTERGYLEHLRVHARSLGIGDRIRFHEAGQDVRATYNAADVYCQPNTAAEPFGIVFVEAMLAGLPVIGTAIGGVREIVDDSCGVLVPPGNSGAIAASLDRFLRDAGLRRKLGAAAVRRARELSDPAVQMSRIAAALNRAASELVVPTC